MRSASREYLGVRGYVLDVLLTFPIAAASQRTVFLLHRAGIPGTVLRLVRLSLRRARCVGPHRDAQQSPVRERDGGQLLGALYLCLRSLQLPCHRVTLFRSCGKQLLRFLSIVFLEVPLESIGDHAKPKLARKSGMSKR